MTQLTETNWESSFQDVISNCKIKGKKLEESVCKNSGNDMVETYKKFEKDAYSKFDKYKTTPFENSKRSIGEDMSFYQQQCNSNFTLIKNYLDKQCKTLIFENNNFLILTVLLVLGIVLIIIGNVFKNKVVKYLFNILGSIMLFFVFVKFSYKMLTD
jgi:hypothetical protein